MMFGSDLPKGNARGVIDTHVVRALHVLMNISASSTSESFNGKVFTFFHLGLIAALDDGDGLACVDLVGVDRVSVQVANRLDCSRWTEGIKHKIMEEY
jgi:hypothetical protein